jgi:predicted adenine nucleotide alpha hydrolase (AANH) superfamily ATPase
MKKQSILLNVCCAPCATVAVGELSKNYQLTVYFWGNNIHPEEEYKRRLSSVVILSEAKNLRCPLIIADYKPLQPKSCEECFELRLRATEEYAKAHGFDFFATSLTTSPHKDADLVNKIGAKISPNYIPTDFKKNDGFNRSIALSKQLGLYRQKYCGCQKPID